MTHMEESIDSSNSSVRAIGELVSKLMEEGTQWLKLSINSIKKIRKVEKVKI